MNIFQAKQIPLHVIVEHLGGRFSKETRPGEKWYFSPFRPEEKTPSFKIDEKTNRWYDFGFVSATNGNKSGGDILDLWCDYHNKDRKSSIQLTLVELASFSNIALQPYEPSKKIDTSSIIKQKEAPRFKILKIHSKIYLQSLKEELNKRRISLSLANSYLKQGYILDTKTEKKYNGFLFKNDKGGHEISIPNPSRKTSFKTSTIPKTITTITGLANEDAADIFEGFWDFLSWLEINKSTKPKHLSYILNSLSFCKEVANILLTSDKLQAVFTFLDNDLAGQKATNEIPYLLLEKDIIVGSRNHIYQEHKDLNDFWMHQ